MFEIRAEQRRCGTIGQIDPAQAVEPDHPGRDTRQHGLGKPPPLVELPICLPKLALLTFDLVSHPVEGAAQRSQFVVLLPFRHTSREIAAADLLGRSDKAADRTGKLGGKMNADGHRRHQEQHRHHHEDQREGNLKPGALAFHLLVQRGGALGLLHVIQHPRLDKPPDIKIDVAELVEPHQRPHPVIAVVGHYRHVAGVGEVDRVVGNGLETQGERKTGPCQHMAGTVEHHRLGQSAQGRLSRDHLLQMLRVERQLHGVAVEIVRHRQNIGTDRLLMFVQIGFSDGQRFGDCGTHSVAEPRLHAKAEEQIGEAGDDHRRQYRD